MKPKRIQRKRTKGWRMPPGAVYVGRPTKWGNQFVPPFSPDENAIMLFHMYLGMIKDLDEFLAPLRGKDLACWCSLDKPCHADLLLELANR